MKRAKRVVKRGAYAILAVTLGAICASSLPIHWPLHFLDFAGIEETTSTNPSGAMDTSNPFFQDLGTNGRTCATCHAAADGFSVTPADLKVRFLRSGGTDPIFRPVDGAVCPTADVSSFDARKQAYRLLLERGLIRVSMPIPDNADFYLESVEDPYDCATSSNMSLYRRPLPASNLRFLTAIMWDGREPNLASQAIDATTGHAQGEVPPADTVQQIVDFEDSLYTAQAVDHRAGMLNSGGAEGGPDALSKQAFYLGINDSLGGDPTGAAFNPNVFTLFEAWKNSRDPWRASVARGEEIFNTRRFAITGVRGLNDKLHQDTIKGTCSTCHDAPNVGDHSLPLALDIGTSSFDPDGTELSYLPKYHFHCQDGEDIVTTDPGRALITGKCSDLSKFKGPVLRGLAARAPYFHNGRAKTLGDVVDFYNERFSIGLTAGERADLIAFLRSL